MGTVEQYGENKGDFASQARPGFWNDPDMVIIISDSVKLVFGTLFLVIGQSVRWVSDCFMHA